MEKVKLGFVGLNRGMYLLRDAQKLKNVEISAVCDLREEKRNEAISFLHDNGVEKVLAFENFDELLESDIDAVIIATDVTLHTAMSVEALNAGKHVLSEIPAINSLEEAEILADACKRHPELKYMMGENCCFWAFINTWKDMYEQGQIGEAFYAEAEYLHNITQIMRDENGNPTWRSKYDAIKYLTHDLGPLLYILNDRVVSVSGFKPGINSIPEYSTGTPDEVAIFRTAKGALIKIFVSFGLNRPCIHNFCIYGTSGTLETDRVEAYTTNASLKSVTNLGEKMFKIPTGTGYPGFEEYGHGGADGKMIEAFADCIIKDEKPPIDVNLGLNMSVPGVFAHMSAEQGGKPLMIPQY